MKTWKRNGVTLSIDRQADGWWSAALRDVDGEVRDSAICERAFPLLRSLARGLRRMALAAAVIGAAVALAGDGKWGEMCKSPPHPAGHDLACPKGSRPEWYCYVPPAGTGAHDPGEWSWRERCVPKESK